MTGQGFKRPCARPGCGNLVERGYCTVHRKAEDAADRRGRGTASQRGYDARWGKVRALHLGREPLCRMCRAEGRVTPAQMVDHILPLRQGGARLREDNLQSLCNSCHNRKTAEDQRRGL